MTPGFLEFHRLGRATRVTLPTGAGGVVHLFVVKGYQGAEEDSGKLLLTVLAEAQVVCVEQPMLILGDLNADPGLFPVWPSLLQQKGWLTLFLLILWVMDRSERLPVGLSWRRGWCQEGFLCRLP